MYCHQVQSFPPSGYRMEVTSVVVYMLRCYVYLSTYIIYVIRTETTLIATSLTIGYDIIGCTVNYMWLVYYNATVHPIILMAVHNNY